ncbi:MAG: MMPL family transporter [Gammaproteobacteria bacterium]|nr:MMPL family transporter [Gammaproteobacteria bacterium]
MQEQLLRFILDRRYLILIITLISALIMAAGMQYLLFSDDYRIYFSEENPQLQAFERLQNIFSKNDNILFVLAPEDDAVFTPETLQAVIWLTEESWKIPFSLRVDSITNFQHTYAEGDDLVVEDLVQAPVDRDKNQLMYRRDSALAEPLLLGRLVSPDAHVTGVNVTIQLPGKALDEVALSAQYARDLADQVRERFPGIQVYLTGVVMMNNAFPEVSQRDMETLYPLMFLVVMISLMLILRSIPATLSTLVVIILAVMANMGLSGWLGIPLSSATTGVPVIILTLAIADCVHVLVNYYQHLRQGENRYEAMLESLRINLEPIFLTSITTAIGFLSLNMSEVPPFRDLGNLAAIGVGLAFFFSITLLPAMMLSLPMAQPKEHSGAHQQMDRFALFVVSNRRLLMWSMVVFVSFLAVQLPKNELDEQYLAYFGKSIPFRADTDFATDNLTGIYTIEYVLDAGEPGAIAEPGFLKQLDAFANWYRAQPETRHVNIFSDIMKRLNKNMHSDDPEWFKLPDSRELAAQYLLLYEFSLPFGLDMNNQINVDKSMIRMTVTLETLSSNELIALEERAQAWLGTNTTAPFGSEGASDSVMFSHIGSRNIVAMLQGSTLALILISAILMVTLRSVKIGIVSMLPNLIPMVMAFGVWGLFVGEVGLALSVVSGLTLGIVVDDTVHFLSKYLRARRERGLSSQDAVGYAFHTVGSAMLVTSVVLVLGFLVLTFSDYTMNADMGLMIAITIGFALLADFLLLPPLLMKLDKAND